MKTRTSIVAALVLAGRFLLLTCHIQATEIDASQMAMNYALTPTGGQPAPSVDAAPATDTAREAFLAEARVVRTRAAGGGGITGARRATLQLGDVRHDALVQTIDEWRSTADLPSGKEFDFRDSYKSNVAAYRLDRLLGLGMVPVSVVRSFDHKPAGFTWWVDDVLMDERARLQKKLEARDVDAWNRQMWVVRVFDQLIYNSDRNAGNLLIDGDWRLWMIDHTRAFKVFGEPNNPKNLGSHCARELLDALRRLDAPTLATATTGLLSDAQIKGLLARRDFIVRYFEDRIREHGESEVVYELPARRP